MRSAFVLQLALEGARAHAQLARDQVESGVAAAQGLEDKPTHIIRQTAAARESLEQLFGVALKYRAALEPWYGKERAERVQAAEAFEVCEYGRRPNKEELARLFPEEGYGFLEAPDGRAVYFHRNSVLDPGFGRLSVGTEVTFIEAEGREGPQASTVKVVGPPRGS